MTRLLKPAFLNNGRILVRSLRVVIVCVLFSVALSLYSEHKGFSMGVLLFENLEQIESSELSVSLQGPRTYDFFAQKYAVLAWFFGFLAMYRLIENFRNRDSTFLLSTLGLLIDALIAGLALYQTWILFSQLDIRSSEGYLLLEFDNVLRNSIGQLHFVVVGTGLYLVLSVFQSILIFLRSLNSKKRDIDKLSVVEQENWNKETGSL